MKFGNARRSKMTQISRTGNFIYFHQETNNYMYLRYYKISGVDNNFLPSMMIYPYDCMRLCNDTNSIQ